MKYIESKYIRVPEVLLHKNIDGTKIFIYCLIRNEYDKSTSRKLIINKSLFSNISEEILNSFYKYKLVSIDADRNYYVSENTYNREYREQIHVSVTGHNINKIMSIRSLGNYGEMLQFYCIMKLYLYNPNLPTISAELKNKINYIRFDFIRKRFGFTKSDTIKYSILFYKARIFHLYSYYGRTYYCYESFNNLANLHFPGLNEYMVDECGEIADRYYDLFFCQSNETVDKLEEDFNAYNEKQIDQDNVLILDFTKLKGIK